MKNKCLAVGIILLFVLIAVNPITGLSDNRYDVIPPVTTISFNPPEPDGENGWYVSPVTVTLNATDNESGVNITKYRIYNSFWMNYTEPFTLYHDGNDIKIEYFSIDAAGNTELVKNTTIDLDRTKPLIALNYTWVRNRWRGIDATYTATSTDSMSGMNRVEFYIDGKLNDIINGSGPYYVSTYSFYYEDICNVRGFILNPKITDHYVKFYSLLVTISAYQKNPQCDQRAYAYDNAGNYDFVFLCWPTLPLTIVPGLYLFKGVLLPNYYTGRIGLFFIDATFYDT